MVIKHGGRGPAHMSRWSKAAGGSAAFSPASLFSGNKGGFWVASDAKTWADTAGTTPITNGAAVARIDDQSGNGNHLLQATAGNRPVWASGTNPYALATAASGHFMNGTFSANLTGTAVTGILAFRYAASTGFARAMTIKGVGPTYGNLDSFAFMIGDATPTTYFASYNSASGNAVTPVIGNDIIWVSGLTATNLSIQVDAGAPSSNAHGLSPALNSSAFSVFDDPGATNPMGGRFYGGLIIDRALTAGEIANCVTYFGAFRAGHFKQGCFNAR